MSDEKFIPSLQDRLSKAAFDVEHALNMYADGYVILPAEAIYDDEVLEQFKDQITSSHIYMVGFVPKIELSDIREEDSQLKLDFSAPVLEKMHTLSFSLPDGAHLRVMPNGSSVVIDRDGRIGWPDEVKTQNRLNRETGWMDFDVKYIGQSYGKDGSRNAVDRLLRHETLQKISLKGVPDGYRLTLLLFSVLPANRVMTMFNPHAMNQDESRINNGIDKLFNTTEQERIALFEACFIRYFYPEYNIEFKESFPSTNLKILKDCYEKDFSAVVAEICIDELPVSLKSAGVGPKRYHIANHDLHKDKDRKIFFGM